MSQEELCVDGKREGRGQCRCVCERERGERERCEGGDREWEVRVSGIELSDFHNLSLS